MPNTLSLDNNYTNTNNIDRKNQLKNKLIKRKLNNKNVIIYKGTIGITILIILWLAFVSSFVIGFILHFNFQKGITASSIMWSLSFVFFILSLIYSIIYFKHNKYC